MRTISRLVTCLLLLYLPTLVVAKESLLAHLAQNHLIVNGKLVAETSHGPHHAMDPASSFWFFLEEPAEFRDWMLGTIRKINGPDEQANPVIALVHPRNVLVDADIPVVGPGFYLTYEEDGTENIFLNPDNHLALLPGIYEAKFVRVSVQEGSFAETLEFHHEDSLSWRFTVMLDGECLEILDEQLTPLPTPISQALPAMGIGRRI